MSFTQVLFQTQTDRWNSRSIATPLHACQTALASRNPKNVGMGPFGDRLTEVVYDNEDNV